MPWNCWDGLYDQCRLKIGGGCENMKNVENHKVQRVLVLKNMKSKYWSILHNINVPKKLHERFYFWKWGCYVPSWVERRIVINFVFSENIDIVFHFQWKDELSSILYYLKRWILSSTMSRMMICRQTYFPPGTKHFHKYTKSWRWFKWTFQYPYYMDWKRREKQGGFVRYSHNVSEKRGRMLKNTALVFYSIYASLPKGLH